jgi:hypothetical protein
MPRAFLAVMPAHKRLNPQLVYLSHVAHLAIALEQQSYVQLATAMWSMRKEQLAIVSRASTCLHVVVAVGVTHLQHKGQEASGWVKH